MEKGELDGLVKSVETLNKGFESLLEKMDSTIGEKVEAAVSELTKNTDEKIEGVEKTLETFKEGIEALVKAMPQYKGVRTVSKGADSEIAKDADSDNEEEEEEDESFEKTNDERAAKKAMKTALTSGVYIQ